MPDGESAVRPAAPANRAMETPPVRVTMARRDGVEHSADGWAGLAGSRPFHPEPQTEEHRRRDLEPSGPLNLLVDSTGIKFLGDGE